MARRAPLGIRAYHRCISTDELVVTTTAAPTIGAESRGAWTSAARSRVPVEVMGLIAVVVAFMAIATLFALQQPPFYDADEKAHLAYAHEVASFHLPEIDTPADPPADAVQWRTELESAQDARYEAVWVANHPPLHYVAAAPLVWLSDAAGRADGGLLFLRLLNITFAAVGIVFTYLLGKEVAGGNRRVGLIAATFVALVPQCYTYFSRALNDGLAFAAATGVVWVALRCSRARPTRRDLAALSGLVAVAAGTRAATMLMAVAVVACVVAYHVVRTRGPARAKVTAGLRVGAIGVGPAVVLWGWFYVRNIALYGDVGASSYLLERFGRTRQDSVVGMLTQGHVWSDLYRRLASTAPLDWSVPRLASAFALVFVVAAAGLAVSAIRRRERRTIYSIGVLCAATAVVAVTVAQHLAGGGSPYPRYLFPAIGLAAVLVAAGLDRLAKGVVAIAMIVVMGGWLTTRIPIGVDATTLERPRDHGLPPVPLQLLPGGDAVRLAVAVVATAAAGVAVAAVAASITAALTGEAATRSPQPRPSPANR